MDVPNARRIVLLGKTGNGKSSLANTILGEATFKVNHFSDLDTQLSQSVTKSVNGRSLTLVDTPGFLGPDGSETDIKTEIWSHMMIECAPGPHAFLLVLKVEKFTEHEQAVVTQMCQIFSEDALNHTIVVFTHGDQLAEGMKMEKYISQSEGLSDLVKKCGGRCHVFDSKYWKGSQEDEYRSNQYQVAELLNSIDEIVMENNGGYYTNAVLLAVEKEIQKAEGRIRRSSKNLSQDEIRKQAKANILKKQNAGLPWIKYLAGLAVAGLFVTASVVVIKFILPAITQASTQPVTPEAVTEITESFTQDIVPAITPAIPSEILPDITPTIPSDIIPDITPTIPSEILPDITPTIPSDIIPDITPAIPSEILPDITPTIPSEVIPNITPTIPSEVIPNITPTIPSEVIPNITPAIPSEILPDITPTIPSEVIPNITPTIPSEVIPNITPAIPPEESVEKTFLTVLTNLWDLFERTYDPFNLFE